MTWLKRNVNIITGDTKLEKYYYGIPVREAD